jgi:twitching motility protein PilT
MDLNTTLRRAAELGASDVHFKLAKPPMLRIDGDIQALDGVEPLTDEDLHSILETITGPVPERRSSFEDSGELDLSYTAAELPRFRVNAYRQRGHTSFAFRLIPRNVPSFEDLRLPPGVARLAGEHRGLVLVTGATGSGKSTTLAAIVRHINATRQQHIVTIEDPIEMLHDDRSCIVNQREVGIDTQSFGQALRRALRQDPDVILIGELRDAETAETALQAAESGHLVLSTLHTVDAAETIGRLVEFFPAVKQQMVRSILAGVLRGVVSQRLLPRLDGGRIAAVEVMITNDRIAELIRENKAEDIPAAIADGMFYDMRTLANALIELTLDGMVDREVAANAAPNRHDFLLALSHAEKVRGAEALMPTVADSLPAKPEPEPQAEQAEEPEAPALRLVRVPAMTTPPGS